MAASAAVERACLRPRFLTVRPTVVSVFDTFVPAAHLSERMHTSYLVGVLYWHRPAGWPFLHPTFFCSFRPYHPGVRPEFLFSVSSHPLSKSRLGCPN